MTARQYLNIATDVARLDTAARMVKNSAAMFVVAVLTNGAALMMAALVARYLGPAALGTYAVVMGLAVLFEVTAPLGQRYVLIRELARDRSRLFAFWANASLVTIASAIALGIVLVLLTHLLRYDAAILPSVYVVCLFLPLAGLRLIAQAVLQGLERMEYLTISALVGRTLGLLVLWVLLQSGVGVVAAFVGHGVFQVTSWLVLVWAILQHGGQFGAIRDWYPDFNLCRTTLRASFPFAVQDFLMKASLRVNVVILPALITMRAVGIFGAADRIRLASAMIIPLVTMAILPTLSRTFVADREQSVVLMEKALKLLLTLIFPFVFIVAIAADQIIPLLYGPGYEAAIPVLRIVIWSQVFFVADAVLNQIMMASDNERPMVRRTALSLGFNVVLSLVLAPRYGAVGVAWAIVLTRSLNLGLDAQYVTSNVSRIDLTDTVARPFLCAALSGVVAFVLHSWELYVVLLLAVGFYVGFLLTFKVFSANEFFLLRRLLGRLWQRVATPKMRSRPTR